MRSLVQWLDEVGFYARDVWDIPSGKMVKNEKLQLFPHQREILQHVFTPDADGKMPYTEIVYSCPKKSGKTLIEACILAWAFDEAPEGSEIYVVANDMEQAAARAFTDLEYHTIRAHGIDAGRNRITNENDTFVTAIAQHYASASGSRPFLSVFDELWAYMAERSRRMWAEMTPPPSVENAMRVTVTYAGYENESDQLLELYNLCFKEEGGRYLNGEDVPELKHIVDGYGRPVCRRNGRTFVYWDTVPRMPWQTPEYYTQQLQTLRPADFLRMHKNRWVSSSETFVPIELYDKCVNGSLSPFTITPDHPFRHFPIALGVDIGLKHDTMALVGSYYDFSRKVCGIAFHRVFIPPPGALLDIEATAETFIREVCKRFNVFAVLYDPYQFQRSAVTLIKAGLPLIEYNQSVSNMIAATSAFYELLRSRKLEVYQDDELRDHVRYASVEISTRGARLVKGKHAKYPIDAAVAMAMSCYWSVKYGGVDASQPIRIMNPFSDSEVIPSVRAEEMALPPELRSYSYE